MTKHEKNVDSVNIIPGTDVSYIDCRVLPEYSLDDVMKDVKEIAKSEQFKDVGIGIEQFNRQDSAPVTDYNSEIVKLLDSAIMDLRGTKTTKIGVGGGTCAAFSRKKGIQSVVWGTQDEMAHQPNEYTDISKILSDAKVYAYLFL
jgi:succinyl-diaminopimelate desuccinylase